MSNKQNKKPTFPRIYTIHSQKGGVGKTSIAVAIAGFSAIVHNKKALIIDADLTGTSLIDIPNFTSIKKVPYFNDLILALAAAVPAPSIALEEITVCRRSLSRVV